MKRMIRTFGIVGLIAATACGGSDPAGPGNAPPAPPPPPATAPPAGANVVFDIQDDAFVDPDGNRNTNAMVAITLGQSVGWTHNGSNTHTVTSTTVPAGAVTFASGALNRGDTFQFTPTAAGMHVFRCEIHPGIMLDARITVTDLGGN